MLDYFKQTYSVHHYAVVTCACAAILSAIGLVTIYSTTSASNIDAGLSPFSDVRTQALAIIGGVVLALFLSKVSLVYNWRKSLILGVWVVCFGLVCLVPIFGVEVNGAKRWLPLGPFTIQPYEFMKIAIIAMTVKILAEYRRGEIAPMNAFGRFALFVVMPLVFVFFTQSDLGTTLVCVAALFAIAYIAGISKKLLLSIVLAFIVGLAFYLFFGGDYRNDRLIFLNPWDDGQNGYGSGFNLIRSLYAIASGGLFGVGIGNSHEKYDYLYAADNDFIFAIICEEGGLLAGLLVIACVCLILICCCKIAEQMNSEEQKLIVYGAAFLLAFQSFLNIGVAVGALPTTGKPLPFVSSGGTSVLASFLLLGLILNAVNGESVRTVADKKRDRLEVIFNRGAMQQNRTFRSRPSFTDMPVKQSNATTVRSNTRVRNLEFVSSFDRSSHINRDRGN